MHYSILTVRTHVPPRIRSTVSCGNTSLPIELSEGSGHGRAGIQRKNTGVQGYQTLNHRKAMQAGTRQIEKRAPDLPTSDQGPRPQRRALDGSRLHGYDALGVGVEGAGSGRDDTADAEVQAALTC